jgi:hypothetical protein
VNRLIIAALAIGTAGGCGASGITATGNPTLGAPTSDVPALMPASTSPAPGVPGSIRDIMKMARFAPLPPGTYFIDPDGKPATALRVVYEIPADGWQEWIGAAKFSDVGHSGVSITTVANLVTDGCTDHAWADPPVGPSVEDLALALTRLAPFDITSPPMDVTKYGYRGTHVEWAVPALPVSKDGEHGHFTGCVHGDLKSWVAFIDTAEPGDAFYGYTGPGYREEFWILDVEGTRLMIAAEHSQGSPAGDLAELQSILDSIRIEL